jgi:sulfate adenylyltransferase subunit 2
MTHITTNSSGNSSLQLFDHKVWNTDSAFSHLQSIGWADTKRTAERRLIQLLAFPESINAESLLDELSRQPNKVVFEWALSKARQKRRLVLFVQLYKFPNLQLCIYACDARGAHYWLPMKKEMSESNISKEVLQNALKKLQAFIDKPITVFLHGNLVGVGRSLVLPASIHFPTEIYQPILQSDNLQNKKTKLTPHLMRLEDESIFIIREAVAEAENPVMLYSVGKDSSVMLHLAKKAFYPGKPPFSLLHVDTRWKFQEMYLMRDRMARESGMNLMVHINPDAIAKDINPFDHGSAIHTDITKTEGLKQALNAHEFDMVFGGARRDEEKSRAKERIFSFRNQAHSWDPKQQRPELWNLFNTRKHRGESFRVFPLSNWTELDIWQYIFHENIPVVPLYFAKERPVVVRNGMILMVDDDRFRLLPDEEIQIKKVRFRTLGCYPLTGAIESNAETLQDIVLELIVARNSERQGRAIDSDASASMEKKKKEGYF